jgi:hypothetical protein
VIGQQQQSARAQHPDHLTDRAAFVGDRAQREGAHHRVEEGIGERQRVGVGLAQVDGAA